MLGLGFPPLVPHLVNNNNFDVNSFGLLQVVGVQQYPIRPQTADVNENILSEQLTSESELTDEIIKLAGRQLEQALSEFELYCSSVHIDPHNSGFRMVTDGQLPVRQCLYPEACRKDIDLPDYYATFHDLRKEVARFTRRTEEVPQSVADMLDCILSLVFILFFKLCSPNYVNFFNLNVL